MYLLKRNTKKKWSISFIYYSAYFVIWSDILHLSDLNTTACTKLWANFASLVIQQSIFSSWACVTWTKNSKLRHFSKLIDEIFFPIFFHHFKQNYFLILFVFLCVGRPQCREDKCHLWDQNAPDVTPPKVNKPHDLDNQSCDIEKIAEILRGRDN